MESISLAVMVRDDATRLKRCIESVAKAVDEVVVLDTGSKDDTVDVARKAGARVVEMEWPGSFSLGLNTLLDEVKTDWTLRLDSDEWFEVDPRKPLRDAVAKKDLYGHKLIRRDILPGGKHREISIFRLWRTHVNLRYEGLVHENISNEGIALAFPKMGVGNLSMWFWHDGYAQGSEEKLRRNIELLEKELEARPDQPYYRAARAILYRDLEDPRALPLLEAVADESVSAKEPSTRMLAGVFSAILLDTPDSRLDEPRVARVAERSWQWFGEYPGVMWSLGLLATRVGNFDSALQAFLRIEHFVETGRYDRSLPFDPDILGPRLYNALGFAAQQVGRMDIAARCAQRLQGRR